SSARPFRRTGMVRPTNLSTRERPIRMTTLKHTIVFPLLAIALTGCASPDTTRREMTSWEGRPVKEPVGCARSTADVRRQAFLHLVWRGAQGSVAVPDVSTNARAPTRGTGYHMSQTQTYCE